VLRLTANNRIGVAKRRFVHVHALSLVLPWATQHTLPTPCPALPCPVLANGRAVVCTSRDTHSPVVTTAAATAIPQIVLRVASLHSLACLPTVPTNTHTLPITVALYIHLHTDITLLGPARLYASDAIPPSERVSKRYQPRPACPPGARPA
jgi:hypothetical protein